MNEENLNKYYNKFNEDKRLKTRHGIVEFNTITNFIDKYISNVNNPKVIDIGAGTGIYSDYLEKKGCDVTAVELVKHNLAYIKTRNKFIKAYQGNATNLSKYKDSSYDIVLLFGPMYHLISEEEKIKALSEAKRIVKDNGYIFVQYCLKDFAIIKHGFIDNNIRSSIDNNIIDKQYNIISNQEDLYSFVSFKDIANLNNKLNIKVIERINPEGLTEYNRSIVNDLSEEDFNEYLKYHLTICNKLEFLGYGRHILEIIQK